MIVRALSLHPVKALRGISVSSAKIVRGGFERDRRWMIVDGKGDFLTQRSHPQLALVDTRIERDRIVLGDTCAIPLEGEGEEIDVVVWKDTVRALHYAPADEWISAIAREPARLVWMPERSLRPVDDSVVSFADAYPFLLASEASLADLNARLPSPIEMRRFRPNIVIDGSRPWIEDDLGSFQIRDVPFESRKGCSRCVVTTIDPETGVADKEPLKTLSTFRERDGKVYFGMNVIAKGDGTIHVGDALS